MRLKLRNGLVLLLTFGCLLHTSAQRVQSVLVLDSAERTPIAGVAISVDGSVLVLTGPQGRAEVPLGHTGTAVMHLAHTSYRPRDVRVDEADVGKEHVVLLAARDRLLPAISVGRAAPEEVFRREDLHAADLLVNDAGIWVLAYEHPRMLRAEGDAGKEILRDVRLVLLDTLFNEVASCPVPEDVLGLRHDLHNEAVIEGTRHAFAVGRNTDGLVLRPFGLEDLRQRVLPWTDSIPGWILGSNANADYPALDHLAYDPVRDTLRRICSVVDSFMMDLFRSEYKYLKGPDKVLAMNLAQKLGVDKEVVAGYMAGFSHNIWYQPLYAPLFAVGDTMLVFDHARSRLRKFTLAMAELPSVPLAYMGKEEGRQWTGRLLQDRVTEKVHAEFKHNGTTWLRAIDPATGAMAAAFKLAVPWPERVQVHHGWVYYIWRPAGSLQKRTVYRERL